MFDVASYTDRITSYHRNKPNYMQTVSVTLQSIVDAQSLLADFPAYFDIDPAWGTSGFSLGFSISFGAPELSGTTIMAIGAQLDILGQWINLSRNVNVPVPDPWFRFDDETRGADEGRWLEPYTTGTYLATLDDDTYRRLLKARITANQWDGTSESAYSTLLQYFDDPRFLLVVDDHTTGDSYYGISGKIPTRVDVELFGGDYLPLTTSGVENIKLITSVDGYPIFGFDCDNEYVGGLDSSAIGMTPSDYLDNL